MSVSPHHSRLQQLSAALAKATGKPEAYGMTLFEGTLP